MDWSKPLNILNTTVSSCPLGDHTSKRSSEHQGTTTQESCQLNNAGTQDDKKSSPLIIDLRDVLVALKGLYDATGDMPALARVMPPDLPSMIYNKATDSGIIKAASDADPPLFQGTDHVQITEFKLPTTAPRVRRPAHVVANDPEYVEKFKKAVQMMKDLPADDPFNFYRQGKIHLDYSNYEQRGRHTSGVPSHVHDSSIFLAGQRLYLYYSERALGKLIGDDSFALPYWNFDSKDGMTLPSIFVDEEPESDIGSFYSSGRDALFYGHHVNVDRMWDVYRGTLGFVNSNDSDWLNAAFYFYDENRRGVRVKLADCLDTSKLGYTYAASPFPRTS